MLTQFLSTTAEIDLMLADTTLHEIYKGRLRLLVGQSPSDESLIERNRVLEEVNNKIAQDALDASDHANLFASNLRLSRIPSKLIEFINKHKATLKCIILSRNNLRHIPIDLFEQLNLEKLDLGNNYFDYNTIDQITALAFPFLIAQPQKSSNPASRSFTPARDNHTAGAGFPIGPQIQQEIDPITHSLRTRSNTTCNLL